MHADATHTPPTTLDLLRAFPLAMRVVVSWTLASATVAGGFFLLFLMASNQMSASHMFPVGPWLFAFGAAAGLVHGGLLAYLGRRLDRSRAEGVRIALLGGIIGAVGLVPTGVVAMWIALASHTWIAGGPLSNAASLAAMVVGLGLCAWSLVDGWRALRNLVKRWPESRVGAPVLLSVLAIAVTAFLLQRPEIWGTDIRVTGIGAVILAVGATVWVASPLVVAILHVVHRYVQWPFEWGTHT